MREKKAHPAYDRLHNRQHLDAPKIKDSALKTEQGGSPSPQCTEQSSKFRATQAIEAVMIVVAGRWGQRASGRYWLIAQRADQLRLVADDALDSR